MARRTVTVTDLLGREHAQHNAFLDQSPSREPGPCEALIDREDGRDADRASVLLWGAGPWPLPGQSRAPLGPDPGAPPEGRAIPYVGPCVACGGGVRRRHHHCLACDRPAGSLAARVASARRRAGREGEGLAGGKGVRATA
jgi:hypothetical protein